MQLLMYLKNSKPFFVWICTILTWVVFSWFYIALEGNTGEGISTAGYFSLIAETGLDSIAAYLAILLWRETKNLKKRNLFLMFSLSFCCATIADTIYNIFLNLSGFKYTNSLIISLFDFPFAIFLLFEVVAWILIIHSNSDSKKIKKLVHAPYFAVSFLMFAMFMFGIPWKIEYFSFLGIIQMIDTMLEVIGFALATICLARAGSQVIRCLTTGYLLIISSDFVIRYYVVSGLIPYLNPMECVWVLGLLITCLGFLQIKNNKNIETFKLLPVNSLQSQMAICILIVWILSIFAFAGIYCLFDTNSGHNVNIIIKNLLSLLVPFSIVAIISSSYISVKLSSPFSRLENIVKDFVKADCFSPSQFVKPESNNFIAEFISLENFVFDAFQLFQKKHILEIEFAKTAAQVTHDIKSPLAALDILICSFKEFPEEQRMLARNAVMRIKDIANSLLQKNRCVPDPSLPFEHFQLDGEVAHNSSLQILSVLIEEIVSEKRLEFSANPNIDIFFLHSSDSYGLFAEIQPIEFRRILSNLLNNAIESLDGPGKVEINIKSLNSVIELRITDNGKGISPEVLQKIGQRGKTFGKKEGNGLGVFHARQSCEAMGGTLKIESKVNIGTTIVITLPKKIPPTWFVSELKLSPNMVICIIDDDFSIIEIWKQRLNELQIFNKTMEIKYFDTACQFEKFIQLLDTSKEFLYLINYDLVGIKTGLDVIEQLGINFNSILLTSYGNGNDNLIHARCGMQGIRLLPKELAKFVPIIFKESKIA